MRYLTIILLLSACGPSPKYTPINYGSIQLPNNGVTIPYGHIPICHGEMLGGICTGPYF